MIWSQYALGTRTLQWSGHGCSGHRTLFEHEYYGSGMDAQVTLTRTVLWFAWMLWSMLWSPYALGTRTAFWLGHDALVTVCSWNTNAIMVWDALATVCSFNMNVIMVWAWMLCGPYALGTRTSKIWQNIGR